LAKENCVELKKIDWYKCKAACNLQASIFKPSETTPAGTASADTNTPVATDPTDTKPGNRPPDTLAGTGSADTEPPTDTKPAGRHQAS
jgi:hypothetical protein